MINAFVTLFTQGDALFYILFVLAIVLLVAEAIIPSFGIIGIGGILMAIGATVSRCLTGDNSTKEIILYIVYILVILLAMIILTKLFHKAHLYRINKKKYAIVDGVKIPLTNEGNLDYSFLLGKEGEVVSDLKPLGKIKIDGNVFEATTTKGYIYSGTLVRVDKVVAQKIIVKKKN